MQQTEKKKAKNLSINLLICGGDISLDIKKPRRYLICLVD